MSIEYAIIIHNAVRCWNRPWRHEHITQMLCRMAEHFCLPISQSAQSLAMIIAFDGSDRTRTRRLRYAESISRELYGDHLFGETKEELAVTLDVGEAFMDAVHEYPDLTVDLALFHANIREGVPQKLENNDIR